MHLGRTIPALPVKDVAAAVEFYRDRLGFTVDHLGDGLAVVVRDDAEIHLWQAGDEGWRQRGTIDQPVRSGAESFLAGTASCRVAVDDVDALHQELRGTKVLHPVSEGDVDVTDHGTREFSALDLDGNLLTFFTRVSR